MLPEESQTPSTKAFTPRLPGAAQLSREESAKKGTPPSWCREGGGKWPSPGLAFSGLLLLSCSDAEHWAWAVSCLLHHNWWLSKGPGVRRFKHQAEHCIIAMIIDPLLNVPITWAKPFALYIA